MRRQLGFIFLAVIIMYMTAAFSATEAHAAYSKIRDEVTGTVVQVIDGDALMIKDNRGLYLVRLLGVSAAGNEDALLYAYNYLMGRRVTAMLDTSEAVSATSGRFTLAYVYLSPLSSAPDLGEMVNEVMLSKGLAKVNPLHKGIDYYSDFIYAETDARGSKRGVWAEKAVTKYRYTGNRVNINTATKEQMQEMLPDIPEAVISRMITYRTYNPFDTVSEVKYVSGFTQELFEKYINIMSVITNINDCTSTELSSLISMSEADVEKIMIHRNDYGEFSSVDELLTYELLTPSRYSINEPFMTIEYDEFLLLSEPNYTVNINTATRLQLEETRVLNNSAAVYAIMNNRFSGEYTYKSIMELAKYPGIASLTSDLNYIADNLHVLTDVNTASEMELRSLFGGYFDSDTVDYYVDSIVYSRPIHGEQDLSYYLGDDVYALIKPFIYFDTPERGDCININTATRALLLEYGFSSTDATKIYNKRYKMLISSDIPVSILGKTHKVSLYTNINTAPLSELLSLSTSMDKTLANNIIKFRSNQPFGTLEEVKAFLTANGGAKVYTEASAFIVVR